MKRRSNMGSEPDSPGAPRGILLLEPDLIGFAGHFFGYVSEIATACQKRFIPLVVVCNRKVSREVTDQLQMRGATVEASFGRLKWFQQLHFSRLRFAWVGVAAARRHSDHAPIILSGRMPLLMGAAATAAASPGLALIQIMNWQKRIQTPAKVKAPWMLRLVARLGYSTGLRFACESKALAPLLSNYLGQTALPLTTIAPRPDALPGPAVPGTRPRIGLLGAGRWEKKPGPVRRGGESQPFEFRARGF